MAGIELLQKSGVVGYLILLLSVISVAVIIEKLIVLRDSSLLPQNEVSVFSELLSQGKLTDVIELCKSKRSFFSQLIYETVKVMAFFSRDNFIRSYEVSARKKLTELERGLTLLATVAAISPLLGLLGTVLGMVKIFGVLKGAGALGSPQELSAGIAEALLTTIFGLIVAIPAVIFYNMFQRKIDKIAAEIEKIGTAIANRIKG
ncbi:MotA/TolQ/ExbB proton channel family protein [Thermovibrio sp.]